MSRYRKPPDKKANKSLPHDGVRDQSQPYAKELEDYSGQGVAKPPEEQTGKHDGREPRRVR